MVELDVKIKQGKLRREAINVLLGAVDCSNVLIIYLDCAY